MISRRLFLSSAAVAAALPAAPAPRFRAPLGTNLYSFRSLAEKDLKGTLKLIRELGFRDLEVGEFYGLAPAAMRRALREAGLTASCLGAEYKALGQSAAAVAAQAHALGAEYVVCSTIPHSARHLTMDDARRAADQLNRWGEQLAGERLKLCYHTHGTEFDRVGEGTVFDTLVQAADPRFANFEMDIFWVVYGFEDPVKLLRRFPGRFPLLHVKDIRKGLRLGGTPAEVEENDSVALGTGLVDVRAALLAAQESGVKQFYLEEEAVDPLPQIRQSLRYIASLRFVQGHR